jgi:NAD(P)-dependent dehydrogenase (short-subunit alcohol dehydrogenase family)
LVLVSSVAGLRGYANIAHYVAAKHGVVGLMRTTPDGDDPRGPVPVRSQSCIEPRLPATTHSDRLSSSYGFESRCGVMESKLIESPGTST